MNIDMNDIDVTKIDEYREQVLSGEYIPLHIHWYIYNAFGGPALRPKDFMQINYIECSDEDFAETLRIASDHDICTLAYTTRIKCKIDIDDVVDYDLASMCIALSAKYDVTVYDYKLVIN